MCGADGPLSVECFVRIDPATGLWAAGSDTRFSPLLSVINADGQLVWTMGFRSFINALGRVVLLTMYRAMPAVDGSFWRLSSGPSAGISSAAEQFSHAAIGWGASGGVNVGCWWDGGGGESGVSNSAGVPHQEGAILRVGGSCTLAGTSDAGATILPLIADIDELRLTAAQRFIVTSGLTVPISALARQTPFPNY